MEFSREITIDAPVEKVWKIIGTDFNEISEWASPVLDSHANPALADGEEGRICQAEGFGEIVETLYQYDDQGRALAFTLEADKNPFFMKKIESVQPLNNDEETTEGESPNAE